MKIFDEFPNISTHNLIIRKMTVDDLEALTLITENDNVYKFVPPLLYKKSKGNLLAAIRNIGERDFNKKKYIIAGIYLSAEPTKLIGLVEIFDYKTRKSQITIGYKLNEDYWNRGVATEVVSILIKYLLDMVNISTIKAFVMAENIYSAKALVKNGFKKEATKAVGHNWGGIENVELDEYTFQ